METQIRGRNSDWEPGIEAWAEKCGLRWIWRENLGNGTSKAFY